MTIFQLLDSGGWIKVNKYLARKIGLHESIMLGELCSKYNYWEQNGGLQEDGFFYCTAEAFEEDITLNRKQQKEAFDNLEKVGLIATSYRGIPRAKYFKLNEQEITDFLLTSNNGKICRTRTAENAEQERQKVPTNIILNNEIKEKDFTTSSIPDKDKDTVKDKDMDVSLTKEKKDIDNKGQLPETSKSYKVLWSFINTTIYSKELMEWYNNVSKGRITIAQLKANIEDTEKHFNGNTEAVKNAIHIAFKKNWMSFYYDDNKQETFSTKYGNTSRTVMQPETNRELSNNVF